jgi:hypothetical protein
MLINAVLDVIILKKMKIGGKCLSITVLGAVQTSHGVYIGLLVHCMLLSLSYG